MTGFKLTALSCVDPDGGTSTNLATGTVSIDLDEDDDEAKAVLADAVAVTEAGAFTMVIESVVEPLARQITATVDVPTIGIGASPSCDGQVLVTEDAAGLFSDFTPRFVKRYAELGEDLGTVAQTYAEDVRARRFPGPEHCFGVPKAAASAK